MNSTPRLKAYTEHPLLSYGFRPFFLGGAVFAGLGILIWMPLFLGQISIPPVSCSAIGAFERAAAARPVTLRFKSALRGSVAGPLLGLCIIDLAAENYAVCIGICLLEIEFRVAAIAFPNVVIGGL
jgi:hypothetical protein